MTKRITPDVMLQHLKNERDAGRMTVVQSLWFEDAAQVWAAEQRVRDTHRQNWQRCVEHAARVEEERNRLREALRELNDASQKVVYGSHKHDFLPGQLRRFLRAHYAADEALAATTDSQVNPGETRVWVDCDGDVRRCPHCLSTCEGGGYVREVTR